VASEVSDGVGSIDFWHTNVADDDVEKEPVLTVIDHFDRLLTVFRFKDFIPGFLQRHLDDFTDIGFVVYHKHPSFAGFSSDKESGFELTHGILLG
jgi:hypothetical protein